jgi:UDP:flavonoid glycosyltransferase YjiC (YdhE family)
VHIPFSKISTNRLLEAIEKTQNGELAQNARELGEKINSEDGVNESLDLIETYFSR